MADSVRQFMVITVGTSGRGPFSGTFPLAPLFGNHIVLLYGTRTSTDAPDTPTFSAPAVAPTQDVGQTPGTGSVPQLTTRVYSKRATGAADQTITTPDPGNATVSIQEHGWFAYELDGAGFGFALDSAPAIGGDSANPHVWPVLAPTALSHGIQIAFIHGTAFGDDSVPAGFTVRYNNNPNAESWKVGELVIPSSAASYAYTGVDTFNKPATMALVQYRGGIPLGGSFAGEPGGGVW